MLAVVCCEVLPGVEHYQSCSYCVQVKDQQEAERKKVTSQEIQQALDEQTKVIASKQEDVRGDLAKVEPAVIDAQQGNACVDITS